MKIKNMFLVAFCGMLSSNVMAQSEQKKEIVIEIHPVRIIAVKSKKQPNGKLKIQYQDRLEHDAANILNQTPEFNSIRKGGNYGFDPVFRGFKYDQLNIVMNGAQSATSACPNRMDPPTSQMAPNMMDRIEILKGPHALRFGTGFGATVNFIPTPLKFSNKRKLYGRVSSGYESNGSLINGEGQLGLNGKMYDISLFGSWSKGDDYTSGNGNKVQAGFNRGSFGTNMGFKLTSNQTLNLSATYNKAKDADFPALPMDLRKDDTWLFNLRHRINFDKANLKSWNTTLFGSFVEHFMDNRLKKMKKRKLNAETSANTYNYGGRTEGLWKFNQSKIYAGADLRIEGAEGKRIRHFLMEQMAGKTLKDNAWQDSQIAKTGFFAEYQYKGSVFNYVLSGRAEVNSAKINEPAESFTNANAKIKAVQFNPSVSLGILKKFNNKFQVGLWLARAQRSGSLTERFINYFPVGQDPYEMLGNPDLLPEVNYEADMNFKVKLNKKSNINIDVFVAYLDDYISSEIDTSLTPVMKMSPGVRRFVNIDKAFKIGAELNWNQYLFANIHHRMNLAYTYGKRLDREEPLPEIAPLDFRYALYANYLEGKLRPEVSFRYVAQQSRVSKEFGERKSPSFNLLDIKVGYRITKNLSVNAGMNNILDKNYFEHLSRSVRGANAPIFAPGRNVFGNVKYSF